jgi:hypothetical protein
VAFVSKGDEIKREMFLESGIISIILEKWSCNKINRNPKTVENLMWLLSNFTIMDNKYKIPLVYVLIFYDIVSD